MNQFTSQTNRPYMVVGSGDIVANVHRINEPRSDDLYRFHLYRSEEGGVVSQSFRPADLRSFVKACQVLAFEMAADGWMSGELRNELIQLSTELDEITFRWSNDDG